jgi:acetyl esterase/lipase
MEVRTIHSTIVCTIGSIHPSTVSLQPSSSIILYLLGDFRYYNNINGGYGFLSSHVAKAAGMGVLAVDYRSASQYPDGIRDIVQACQWLTAKGASDIFLYGDSSGGTIVAETLLWIAHHRLANNSLNVSISGAATFSAWLDFTASSPTYESIRWCDGSCYGTGDPVEVEPPGWARMSAFCDAQHYTGPNVPYNMPIVNPMSSPPYLLAELPPMMLVIGSRDILLGDNLMFAQAAQAAGAAVQVEVFEGMWHDFEEESQGCGARGHLVRAA